jgi:hypothetical protein
MDPLTLAALIGAGSAVTKGVGGAIAAAKSFNKEDQAELDRLLRRRSMGRLGISDREREGMEQRALAGQAGLSRDLQAQGMTQAAAAGSAAGGGVSGRDLFLRQLGQGQALAEAQQKAGQEIAQVSEARRGEQQARIAELQAMKKGRKQGIVSALTGGLAGVADTGAQVAMTKAQQEHDEKLLIAEMGGAPTVGTLKKQVGAKPSPYSSRIAR